MIVSEQISWTSNGDELKAYLGLNGVTAELAAKLQLFLGAMIKLADKHLVDFIIHRARWVIGPTVEAGYVYTLTVTPEDESAYTAFTVSYTASAGDSAQRVAYELRKALDLALASRAVTVGGAGAAIEAVSDDLFVAMEASHTKSGTNATVTETLFDSTVPTDVKLGVFEGVKALQKTFGRAQGVTSVRTAVAGESYASGPVAEVALAAAAPYWDGYLKEPLLAGASR